MLTPRLDWTAFTSPVSLQQVQTWKAAAKASGARWTGYNIARITLVLVLAIPTIALSVFAGFVSLAFAIGEFALAGLGGVVGGAVVLVIGLFCFALAAFMLWACFKVFPSEHRWER